MHQLQRSKIASLFKKENSQLHAEMIRYTAVAIIALAVDLGILSLLISVFHINALVAVTIGFLCGLIVNYCLSRAWVFQKNRLTNQKLEFLIFAAVGITGLLWNDLIFWIGQSVLELHYFYAKMIATALVFFWNFFLRKYLLYR